MFTVSSASLLLTRLAPGDYATEALGIGAGRERLERDARRATGSIGRSLEQYRDWLAGTLRFDFGRSLAYDRPVADLIPERAANTAILAVDGAHRRHRSSACRSASSPARARGGAAVGRDSRRVARAAVDAAAADVAVAGLRRRAHRLAADRRHESGPSGSARRAMLDLLRHLVVPALALALPLAAMFERLQAQAMHEVIGQPYVLAALARGVPRSRMLWRDALKAALGPGRLGLRPRRRHAAQRIVRRRNDHRRGRASAG